MATQETELSAQTEVIYNEQKVDGEDDESQPSAPPDICELGLRLRIDQLATIDTATQTYGGKFRLEKEWIATKKDINNYAANKAEYKPEYYASVEANNDVVQEYEYARFNGGNNICLRKSRINGLYYNFQSLETRGSLTSQFDVKNYPFDIQDLSFVFSTEMLVDEIIIVKSFLEHDTFSFDTTWCPVTDWNIIGVDCMTSHINLDQIKGHSSETEKKSNIKAFITFRIQVQRKWEAIMMRTIVWMFLMAFYMLFMFSLEPTDIEGRMAYSITMMLTIVAFQFVISSDLPNISYMTLIDKYNFIVMSIILLISAEAVLVGYHGNGFVKFDNFTMNQIDQIFAQIFISLFVICHIVIFIYFKKKMNDEKLKLGAWKGMNLTYETCTEMK
eukprot:251958_1